MCICVVETVYVDIHFKKNSSKQTFAYGSVTILLLTYRFFFFASRLENGVTTTSTTDAALIKTTPKSKSSCFPRMFPFMRDFRVALLHAHR